MFVKWQQRSGRIFQTVYIILFKTRVKFKLDFVV